MNEIVCPYKPCGSSKNCVGCCYDPEHREMTKEEFWDANPCLRCSDCIYYKCNAELESVESTCKRLDHKHIQFAVPWFKSYDCNGGICNDFEPVEWKLWLYRHWKPEFKKKEFPEYCYGNSTKGKLHLCLDGNQKVRYSVKEKDFYFGDFLDENGDLKWVEKLYYKRTSSSPCGYKLIFECREKV